MLQIIDFPPNGSPGFEKLTRYEKQGFISVSKKLKPSESSRVLALTVYLPQTSQSTRRKKENYVSEVMVYATTEKD